MTLSLSSDIPVEFAYKYIAGIGYLLPARKIIFTLLALPGELLTPPLLRPVLVPFQLNQPAAPLVIVVMTSFQGLSNRCDARHICCLSGTQELLALTDRGVKSGMFVQTCWWAASRFMGPVAEVSEQAGPSSMSINSVYTVYSGPFCHEMRGRADVFGKRDSIAAWVVPSSPTLRIHCKSKDSQVHFS